MKLCWLENRLVLKKFMVKAEIVTVSNQGFVLIGRLDSFFLPPTGFAPGRS